MSVLEVPDKSRPKKLLEVCTRRLTKALIAENRQQLQTIADLLHHRRIRLIT